MELKMKTLKIAAQIKKKVMNPVNDYCIYVCLGIGVALVNLHRLGKTQTSLA